MQSIRQCSTRKILKTNKYIFLYAVAATISIASPGLCDNSTTGNGAASGSLTAPSTTSTAPSTTSTAPSTTSTAPSTTSTVPSTTSSAPSTTLIAPSTTSSASSTNSSTSGAADSTTTPGTSRESTSPQPATSAGFKPWLGEEPGKPAAAPKVNKPTETPPPPGMDAAMKLFKERKWALAQKSFEGFINSGKADVQTHQCLAYCYYYQRIYSKAMVQFEWVAKNATHISEKNSAANTARVLRCYRAGVCPSSCLKPNDPRWAKVPGSDELWITFHYPGGYERWSEHHVGQLITYVNGKPENQGVCPTCGGSGTVKVLKDGAPPPTQ